MPRQPAGWKPALRHSYPKAGAPGWYEAAPMALAEAAGLTTLGYTLNHASTHSSFANSALVGQIGFSTGG